MKHTVVAVFDNADQVQKAAETLTARGFDGSALHITRGTERADTEVPPAAEVEAGPIAGLLHRLSVLFGVKEPHVAHYLEAVRRGGHVLQVDAPDEVHATAARDTLLQLGAVDIDDRVEAWEEAGWTAPAEDASAPTGVVVHRKEVSIGGVRVYGHTDVQGYEEFAGEFRSDYEARYAGEGARYEDFDPAYRFGYELATERIAESTWSEIEGDARDEWQSRHPQNPWDRVANAVRHAWERVVRR